MTQTTLAVLSDADQKARLQEMWSAIEETEGMIAEKKLEIRTLKESLDDFKSRLAQGMRDIATGQQTMGVQ